MWVCELCYISSSRLDSFSASFFNWGAELREDLITGLCMLKNVLSVLQFALIGIALVWLCCLLICQGIIFTAFHFDVLKWSIEYPSIFKVWGDRNLILDYVHYALWPLLWICIRLLNKTEKQKLDSRTSAAYVGYKEWNICSLYNPCHLIDTLMQVVVGCNYVWNAYWLPSILLRWTSDHLQEGTMLVMYILNFLLSFPLILLILHCF